MGSASSKAARKLPKQKPSWAGARTGEPPATPPAGQAHPNKPPVHESPSAPLASETRSAAVEKDGRDPQFMANLTRLGQVKVDHHMQTYRTSATRMSQMFQSRAESELQASSTAHVTRDRVVAPAIAALLARRHELPTASPELRKLAEEQGISPDTLERVARFVNVPTVKPGSEVKTVKPDGTTDVKTTAYWVSPVADPQLRLQASSTSH